MGGETLFVYASSGRATRSIGRAGEGPGELGRDLRIVGSGNRLVVVDRRRLAVVTLDLEGNHLGTATLEWRPWNSARLRDGGFVFSATPVDLDEASFRLVRVADSTGGLIASHDLVSAELATRMMPDLDGRRVAPARSGLYWTAVRWSYELHRWAAPGQRDLVIVREADWFEPNRMGSINDIDAWYITEPPPRDVFHMHEAADGLLWVYAQIPDERWTPGSEPDDATSVHLALDTMIEVIDPEAGELVAQLRFDERLGAVCDGSEFMTTVRETPGGDTRMVVMRPTLQRGPT